MCFGCFFRTLAVNFVSDFFLINQRVDLQLLSTPRSPSWFQKSTVYDMISHVGQQQQHTHAHAHTHTTSMEMYAKTSQDYAWWVLPTLQRGYRKMSSDHWKSSETTFLQLLCNTGMNRQVYIPDSSMIYSNIKESSDWLHEAENRQQHVILPWTDRKTAGDTRTKLQGKACCTLKCLLPGKNQKLSRVELILACPWLWPCWGLHITYSLWFLSDKGW